MNSFDAAIETIHEHAMGAYLVDSLCLCDELKDRKVYLSGAITNKKNYKGLFLFAERIAKSCDASRIFNPARQIPSNLDYWSAMKRCIAALVECDTIVMLPGWGKSRGAKMEYDIAVFCGIDVCDFEENPVVKSFYCDLEKELKRLL